MVTPMRIAARLEYATLEELEAGFAERLGDHELFLAHGSFGALPDEPRVGTAVVVEIATASGETALALDGVIAWSYPHTMVPPGREAGTGVHIDRFLLGSEVRAGRMRKRRGAGVRVRAPGSRLKAPVVERTRAAAVVPRPLPASLFEVEAKPTSSAPPDAGWSSPAPRLMGLALHDKTFDPTPASSSASLPRELPADDLPAPPTTSSSANPAVVSLDALPDLPSAVSGSAFEQVPTDVDLLRSVNDVEVLAGRQPSGTFERRPLIDVTGPRLAPVALDAEPASAEPAAAHRGLPDQLSGAEPELVSDDDVSPVDDDSTGSHEVPVSRLPSLDAAEFETAEHATLAPSGSSPSAADWEGRTEHGLDASEPTAEASDPGESAPPARPLPKPVAWPTQTERSPRPIGVAFMVARRSHEPVGLEVLTWPALGTKRVGALDEAREQGGEALDQAIASTQWLARDASAGDGATHAEQAGYFDAGLTDPGRRVVDVVGAAVQAAESEPEGGDVFSEALTRPASTAVNPALDEPTVAEDPDDVRPAPSADEPPTLAGDDTVDSVRAAAPLLADDEVETDRALQRPPTESSAATKSRLGVLQRILGKR